MGLVAALRLALSLTHALTSISHWLCIASVGSSGRAHADPQASTTRCSRPCALHIERGARGRGAQSSLLVLSEPELSVWHGDGRAHLASHEGRRIVPRARDHVRVGRLRGAHACRARRLVLAAAPVASFPLTARETALIGETLFGGSPPRMQSSSAAVRGETSGPWAMVRMTSWLCGGKETA